MAGEIERVSTVVGKDGKITQRAVLAGAVGAWARTIGSVNSLITDLAQPTAEVGRVIGAVAKGDLSHSMASRDRRSTARRRVPAHRADRQHDGRPAAVVRSEVTRVAREVGTEGKLGGQAEVRGVSGTWKDLTDSVNSMAEQPDRPGPQHRRGDQGGRQRRPQQEDHGRRQGRDPRAEEHHQHDGRPAQLVRHEVTRVAREVGTEGKLGGRRS
jgi:hypothetical protein